MYTVCKYTVKKVGDIVNKKKKKTYDVTEKRFKSVDDLIAFIELKDPKKLKCEILYLVGNELDVNKLIKRYNLKKVDNWEKMVYGMFKLWANPPRNSFCVSALSEYGGRIVRCNVKGQRIDISIRPCSKLEHRFSSTLVGEFNGDTNYVVLDIETTGLSPILDDIIQICFLKNNKNYYSKYLPLTKKDTNTAFEINKIEDEVLKDATHLTQQEVDEIVEKFDLKNNVVVVWSGKNQFDRLFLECYFLDHDLKGLDQIKFFNAKSMLSDYLGLDQRKDAIAELYGISTNEAHNAVEDCIIERQIVENLLNGYVAPLLEASYSKKINDVKAFLFGEEKSKEAAEVLYDSFCICIRGKNGYVFEDYDKPHKTRGKEWIDIHHLDEKSIPNIATMTNHAVMLNDTETLEELRPYNKKERLVYATKVEHFLLHCLIAIMRSDFSGGVHFTFGDIVKIKSGCFSEGSKEFNIQSMQSDFFKEITFEEIINIYAMNVKYTEVDLNECVENFYKLNTYVQDHEKYNEIMEKVRSGLK